MEDDVAELISDTMIAVTMLRVKHDRLKADLRRLVADIENRAVLHRRRLEFTALETCNSIIHQAKKLLDGG